MMLMLVYKQVQIYQHEYIHPKINEIMFQIIDRIHHTKKSHFERLIFLYVREKKDQSTSLLSLAHLYSTRRYEVVRFRQSKLICSISYVAYRIVDLNSRIFLKLLMLISIAEITSWICLNILMGYHKLPSYKNYSSSNLNFNVPTVSKTISRHTHSQKS